MNMRHVLLYTAVILAAVFLLNSITMSSFDRLQISLTPPRPSATRSSTITPAVVAPATIIAAAASPAHPASSLAVGAVRLGPSRTTSNATVADSHELTQREAEMAQREAEMAQRFSYHQSMLSGLNSRYNQRLEALSNRESSLLAAMRLMLVNSNRLRYNQTIAARYKEQLIENGIMPVEDEYVIPPVITGEICFVFACILF